MTTTMSPLPVPFSKNKPHFTANQVLLYATQARADLEAENKRLREALEFVARHKSSDWPERCQQMVDMARAVLKEQP